MRTEEAGVIGVCIVPDGSECEEWEFFRDECRPGSAGE
jgi:putative hemolysin